MSARHAALLALALLLAPARAAAAPGAPAAPAPVPSPAQTAAPGAAQADIELFTRKGCPRCAEAKVFLEELRRERPGLTVVVADVSADRAALDRLRRLAEAQRIPALSVPVFHVRGALVVGYAGRATTGRRVEALLEGAAPAASDHAGEGTCAVEEAAGDEGCAPGAPGAAPDSVDVPVLGRLSLRDLGLPAFTLLIGLVDGFNPCAMWVLLFLLSFLVNLKSRPKMLLIAGTFVVVSGLAYFAFMAAWLNVFLLIGLSRAVQVALGVIGLVAGGIHIKDYFAFHKGVTLSIPESAKPTLYARMRAIIQAERLWAALGSAIVLAVLVNIVELLCTAGLPALYTQVLTAQGLPAWKHYAYLALYIAAYMLDDTIMVTVGVITLSRKKLQEKGGRQLKLLSGLVMVALAALLIVKPEWLTAL